jgi:hypothetical protein
MYSKGAGARLTTGYLYVFVGSGLVKQAVTNKILLTFIHSTGRFKEYAQSEDRPMTNARRNTELIAKARALGLL